MSADDPNSATTAPDAGPDEEAADPAEAGYQPGVGREGGPHAPGVGGDAEDRSWRRLGHELTHARDVSTLVDTVRTYGWVPPLLGLVVHGGARGVFEHAAEPYAMSQRYVFEGWQFALGINVVFGLALTAFSWFLFFGVAGSIAGYFSTTSKLDAAVFKTGGYLMVLFVPLLLVASAVAATIPPPEAVAAGTGTVSEVAATHQYVDGTVQMRIIEAGLAAGWIVAGFLLIPVVSELYDVDRKASVVAVLPVTLIAVVATHLV